MSAFRWPSGPAPARWLRSSYHGWPFRVAVAAALIMAAVAGPLRAPSNAVNGGRPAPDALGSVRLFQSGQFISGGVLVDRHWVIVPAHVLQAPGSWQTYSIRFGVVTNANDRSDARNLRTIDRPIVFAPQGGLAMMHFADPVPADTIIPPLATRAPRRYTASYFVGWGGPGAESGTQLNIEETLVYDPIAVENAADMRASIEGFADSFAGVEPMVVVPDLAQPGDVGSLVYVDEGFLLGIHTMTGSYYHVNRQGNMSTEERLAGYEQPMWHYRQWVQDTIHGVGPSGTAPGSNRRRLTDVTTGHPTMTLPPQTSSCVPHLGSCTTTPPTRAQGVLLGAGNFRGTAQARCATAAHNTCSFDGVTTAPGASTRMRLGTTTAPSAPGTRDVIAWCQTTTPFPDATSPTRQVLRVSFTNADPDDTPTGYGWWDITPDQVGTGNGQTLLDPGPLAPC
jgi:Trypsin